MKIDIRSMTVTDEVLSILPPQMAEISTLIGLTATLTLVDKFGGLSFEIPRSLNSKNGKWLVQELGADIAQIIINHYQGEKLYINNCDALRVYLRNHALVASIVSKMETGVSQHRAIQETALEFNITERRTYDILKDMTNNNSELSLF